MNGRKEPVVDDCEWEAQERGLRAARNGESSAADPEIEVYRRLASALSCAPHSAPPADFASRIARQVAAPDTGIEIALHRSLLVVLALTSFIVIALYGGQWWQAARAALTGSALPWFLAGIGCLVLTWTVSQVQRFRTEMRITDSQASGVTQPH